MSSRRVSFCVVLTTTLLAVVGPHGGRPAFDDDTGTAGGRARPTRSQAIEEYGRLPLAFEANHGQTDTQVHFLSRGAGYTLFLTGQEAVLALKRPYAEDSATVRLNVVGGKAAPSVSAEGPLPGRVNYLLGNDPANWRTDVPLFGKVRYSEVYPDVDLVYYGNQRQLEFDFVVAPGGDPSQIRLGAVGALRHTLEPSGDLVLGLEHGEVRLHKPRIYQEGDGRAHDVAGAFVVRGAHEISFDIGAYDRTRPLIIDPVLVYSTFLGGTGSDAGVDVAVDSLGRAYIAGVTNSTNFPVSASPYRATAAGGSDVFVTRLEANGSLSYSSYLGGTLDDNARGIAVDASGNAYVAGVTESIDYPTFPKPCGSFPFAPCPFQTANAGGTDAFVTKLNSSGSLPVYSTYVGGTSNDSAEAIALDASNAVYLTGSVSAGGFPVTPGALQTTVELGCQENVANCQGDAFVAKLINTGRGLEYATYLRSASGTDAGLGIDVDDGGNAYITGVTHGTGFPVTPGAVQTVAINDLCNPFLFAVCSDAFVSKLNSTGSALVYSTFLGGRESDVGNDIKVRCAFTVRTDCFAYVVGETWSSNFPIANAVQPTAAGMGDAFVARLSDDGSVLLYSTYLGGSREDGGYGIDVLGNSAVVIGATRSPDFPMLHSMQPAGGDSDAFLGRFTASGALFFSSYLGGDRNDSGHALAVDSAGNAYVTGSTASADFPTANAFQSTKNGTTLGTDAFVAKVSPEFQPSANAGPDQTLLAAAVGNTPFTLAGSGVDPDNDPLTYEWRDATNTIVGTTAASNLSRPAGVHVFTLYVRDNGGGVGTDTVTVIIHRPPVANAGPDQVNEAASNSAAAFTLDGTASADPDGNPITYEWRDATNTVVGTAATAALSRTLGSHVFTLVVRDSHGVSSSPDSVTIIVRDTTSPTVAVIRPNGGDKLFTNTPYLIEWTASDNGTIALFDVAYSVDAGSTFVPVPGCSGVSGTARSCTWNAPSPTTTTGRVRVSAQDASGGRASDSSNGNHLIVTGFATVALTQPNGIVNWGIGSTQQIKWTHNLGAESYMRIEFSADSGRTWTVLDPAFKNTGASAGTYPWTIISTPSDAALVRVSWANGPDVSGVSPAEFDLSEPYVAVVSPATTATRYGYGTSRQQAWTTNLGPLDKVHVHLSTDGGVTFPIVLGTNITATAKKLNFIVPAVASPSSTARIRVQFAANALVQGVTPTNLQIAAPYVRVTNPNVTGHTWAAGSSRTITWASNLGTSENVKIELSLDDGQTFPIVLAASTKADGSQSVSVEPGWVTQNARVRVTWLKNAAVADVSDAKFVIQ